MNIVFYLHQYPAFGGIETVTSVLANHLAGLGHLVTIVSYVQRSGTTLLGGLHDRVEWCKMPFASLDKEQENANAAFLVDLFRQRRTDVVVFQDSYCNIQQPLWLALERCTDRPRLVTVEHSAPTYDCRIKYTGVVYKDAVLALFRPWFIYRRRLYNRRRRLELYEKSDRYVLLSKNYWPVFKKILRCDEMEKVRFIPNPVSAAVGGGAAIAECGMRKVVLFVGSLIPLKGVDRLLSAWECVSGAHADWSFFIVGDGVERSRLERIVQERGLRNVRFLGFCADVRAFYAQASIFVMASDREGWPMVLGEAMSNGLVPLLYDGFAAAGDIVENGVSGIVVPAFEESAFAESLRRLMVDDQLRNAMAGRAREKAARYTIDVVGDTWNVLLRSLTARRSEMSETIGR